MLYIICIGSNECRTANLALAHRRLKELFPDICFSRVSNQVARFTTDCQEEEVAARLKAIEREAGRKPDEKKREIVRLDIDVLSCDTLVYKPDDLKRDYVVRGLKELELTSFV